MPDSTDALLKQTAELASRIERIEAESLSKSAQVTLLSEVGRALQSTMEIDQLLRVILAAVTAGDGLGLNRAFLLLLDESGSVIRGRMAVGPSEPGEAGEIWKAMENEGRSLSEILRVYSSRSGPGADGILKTAARLVFPFDGAGNIVSRSLDEGRSVVVEDARDLPDAREIAGILNSDHFLIVPLVAEGRKLGAILADNFVTGRRIGPEDVRLLETFASQAALAIANASLHKNLQERLRQLEVAHNELSQNHLQLMRAERLVALGGLAASFMHDLKAPIVSIGLMARAAAAKLVEEDPSKGTFEKIAEEIVEIEKYLKGVARSAERGPRELVQVDISGIVRDSLNLIRGSMITGNVKTTLGFGHGDAKIRGNPLELRQMLLNILHNSVEALPDGGDLTVETGVESDMVRISIGDTGTGIPEGVKPKVFSLFFTTKPEGSGLGLFIAKRIVRDYGGSISFESTEGKGTCFSILLPVDKEHSEAGRARTQ
ncbi:MAG: ATP-binding protein [Candidatus Eisenbacteria bacterium]